MGRAGATAAAGLLRAAAAPASRAGTSAPQTDMLGQLQKLGELKAAGVLTEEEFAIQKARILAAG